MMEAAIIIIISSFYSSVEHKALKMEAAITSEMLVDLYQITWRNIPQESHLHTCYSENLKSY
jgi:hypothetical protein